MADYWDMLRKQTEEFDTSPYSSMINYQMSGLDPFKPLYATDMINAQDAAFYAMPNTQVTTPIGSLSNIGKSVGDWWNNTKWGGAGGKFETMANWGGKAVDALGAFTAYQNMRTGKKATNEAIKNMQLSRQAALAQLSTGKRKELAREKIMTDPGTSAKDAYAYASAESDKYMADKFNWKA